MSEENKEIGQLHYKQMSLIMKNTFDLHVPQGSEGIKEIEQLPYKQMSLIMNNTFDLHV